MFNDMRASVKEERRRTIRAARDLLYGEEVVCKLKMAKTITEMSNIMNTARKGKE